MEILFHVDLGCLEIRQHISVTKDGRKYSTFCGLVVFLLKKIITTVTRHYRIDLIKLTIRHFLRTISENCILFVSWTKTKI